MSIMYKFRFEFFELSDWFEYGLKAVGSQARQRCHPVVCRLETIVEGTCLLYKMYIDVGSRTKNGPSVKSSGRGTGSHVVSGRGRG